MSQKIGYVCGPLTELPPEQREAIKRFYGRIADLCQHITDQRAFVPHEHYDPIKHGNYTPAQVDEAERRQVCELTSVLVVVAIAPSWGGGIEVEMAYRSQIPVVLLCEREKLEQKKISRLLRGNPAVVAEIVYDSHIEAIGKLKKELYKILKIV